MKTLAALLCALSISACSFFTKDLTYRDMQGTIILKQTPCLLPNITSEGKKEFKEAIVQVLDQPPIKGCWMEGANIDPSAKDTYFVIAENGGYALFPKDKFK